MATKGRRKKAPGPERKSLTENQRTERMKGRGALLAGMGTFMLGLAALLTIGLAWLQRGGS